MAAEKLEGGTEDEASMWDIKASIYAEIQAQGGPESCDPDLLVAHAYAWQLAAESAGF